MLVIKEKEKKDYYIWGLGLGEIDDEIIFCVIRFVFRVVVLEVVVFKI